MKKIKLSCAVLCEGKYDKIKLSSFIDGVILTTDGFSVFNNAQKRAMLKRICMTKGLVIITDSDRAGGFIRSRLKGMLPNDKVRHIFIPQIKGKEKRKEKASKDGYLGVEGIDVEKLRELFEKAGLTVDGQGEKSTVPVTKAQLYSLGLSGGTDSSHARQELCKRLDLPTDLTAGALINALEMLDISYERLCELVNCESQNETQAQNQRGRIDFPDEVCAIAQNLINSGHEAYFVGGCVRDYFMNRTPNDFDITTNASSDKIISCQQKNGAEAVLIGGSCGTVLVKFGGCEAEVTPYRSEADYADFRHPSSVCFVNDLSLDLSRRDFTVNAIAMSLDKNKMPVLRDDFGGIDDINAGVLRCVGEAEKRFNEDALRILRALRFSAQLKLEISHETKTAIHKASGLVAHVSAERILSELEKLLSFDKVQAIFSEYRDVFSIFLEEYDEEGLDDVPHELCKRLFFLKRKESAQKLLKRLFDMKLSTRQRNEIIRYKAIYDKYGIELSRDNAICALAEFGESFCEYVKIFAKNPKFAEQNSFSDIIDNPQLPKSIAQLKINGDMLKELGMSGRQIGEVLSRLLVCAIEGSVENDEHQLMQMAAHIMNV